MLKKILTLFAVALSMTLTSFAHAGTLKLHDNLHALSADDVAALNEAVASSALDFIVLIDRAASKDELDNIVHLMIDTPTTVAIGLDPDHRYVRVNFGISTGVPSRDYGRVTQAGNPSFKAQNWGQGLLDIVQTANAMRRAPAPAPVAAAPFLGTAVQANTPINDGHGPFYWIFVLAFVAFAIYLAYRWYMWVFAPMPTSSAFGDDDLPESYPYTKGTRTGYPSTRQALPRRNAGTGTTVINNTTSGSDMAVGVLIGESLGRSERQMPTYRAAPTPTYVPPAPAPTIDAGGSSSSFDIPPVSIPTPTYRAPTPIPAPRKSSYHDDDAGGSSSSFDSSFDSGSSFDGGGSGSDF